MQSRGNINENMEIREQSSNYRTHNASQPITNINDNYPSLRRACNILLRGRLSNAAVRRGHALKSGSSREKASAKSPNNLNRLSRDSLFLPAARCDLGHGSTNISPPFTVDACCFGLIFFHDPSTHGEVLKEIFFENTAHVALAEMARRWSSARIRPLEGE